MIGFIHFKERSIYNFELLPDLRMWRNGHHFDIYDVWTHV